MAFSYQAWGTIWRGPCLPERTSCCVLLYSTSWGFGLLFTEALATSPTDTSMKTRKSILLYRLAFLFDWDLLLLFALGCFQLILICDSGWTVGTIHVQVCWFTLTGNLYFQVHWSRTNCETQNSMGTPITPVTWGWCYLGRTSQERSELF